MQCSFHTCGRLPALLAIAALVIILIGAFGGSSRSAAELTTMAFQSPIETPTPPPAPSTPDVDLQIICAQPERLRQSVPVTISVTVRNDIAQLRIHLFAGSPHAALTGAHTRVVDMRAGETLIFTNDVRLSREGLFNFVAQASVRQGRVALASCNMLIGQPGEIFLHPNRPPEAKGIDQPIEKLPPGSAISPQPTPRPGTPDPFVSPLPTPTAPNSATAPDSFSTGQAPANARPSVPSSPAGMITLYGHFHYYDRGQQDYIGAANVRVRLWDANLDLFDQLVGETRTDSNGNWTIGPILNNDTEGDGTTLDPYIDFDTDVTLGDGSRLKVGIPDGAPYTAYVWWTETRQNISDGDSYWLYGAANNTSGNSAMWLFQDISRAWAHWKANYPIGRPAKTDSITMLWRPGVTSRTGCNGACYFDGGINGIFIPDGAHNYPDITVHETGHRFLHATMGTFWSPTCPNPHYVYGNDGAECAWSEGWSDFFAVSANNGRCFDFVSGDCQGNISDSHNLEEQGWTDYWDQPGRSWTGDGVEGRVAGVLWDIQDDQDEGLDSIRAGFAAIEAHMYLYSSQEHSLNDFYTRWSTYNSSRHVTALTMYQNTVDYDTPPRFDPLLPTITALQGVSSGPALDLWAYAKDNESQPAEMSYGISSISHPNCGFSIDGRYLYVAPVAAPEWCYAIISVSDGIKNFTQWWNVHVVPVRARVYVPLALNGVGGATGQGANTPTPTPTRTPTHIPSQFQLPLSTPTPVATHAP